MSSLRTIPGMLWATVSVRVEQRVYQNITVDIGPVIEEKLTSLDAPRFTLMRCPSVDIFTTQLLALNFRFILYLWYILLCYVLLSSQDHVPDSVNVQIDCQSGSRALENYPRPLGLQRTSTYIRSVR
jgi:hypothetical protein